MPSEMHDDTTRRCRDPQRGDSSCPRVRGAVRPARRHPARRSLGKIPAWTLALLAAACSGRGCSKSDTAPPTEAPPVVSSAAPSATNTQSPRSRSAALEHLPANCLGVLRVNWAQLVKLPAIEQHLRAAYEPDGAANAQLPPEQQAFLAFLRHAGIDPFEDVDQLVVCGGEHGPSGGVMIIGGNFPQGLPELMKKHAPHGQDFVVAERGGHRYLQMQGQYLVQASDNAVLLGQDLDQTLSATAVTKNARDYELPAEGELAAVARGPALLQLLAPGAVSTPMGKSLEGLQRMQASLTATSGQLAAAAVFESPAQAETIAAQVRRMLAEMIKQAERAPVAMRLVMAPNLALARSVELSTDGTTLSAKLKLPRGWIEGMLARTMGPTSSPNGSASAVPAPAGPSNAAASSGATP